jgi:hypothetical protein
MLVFPPRAVGWRDMGTLYLILIMVALLGLAFGLQYLRTRRAPFGRVLHIFTDIRYAEKLCREFSYNQKVKRFRISGWGTNKERVPFLPEDLRAELDKVFAMLADVNLKIDSAVKFKSDAYLVTVEVKNLEEPLANAKKKLQEWLQANLHNPEYQPKKVSLFRW